MPQLALKVLLLSARVKVIKLLRRKLLGRGKRQCKRKIRFLGIYLTRMTLEEKMGLYVTSCQLGVENWLCQSHLWCRVRWGQGQFCCPRSNIRTILRSDVLRVAIIYVLVIQLLFDVQMRRVSLILFLALAFTCSALYDRFSAVKQLTTSDFSQVKKGIWLVEFYAPWCGHCKNLAPEYDKAAKALKGIANIAAVDATKQQVDVQVQGYPTIKFFVDGKASDYDGPRSADGIVDFMLRKFRNIANERIGGGSSGSSHHGSESGGIDQRDVVVLTDKNFEDHVYGDDSAWFVQFYAPWCGHCKSLAPEWAELATNLKGEIKVAKVDATENKQIAGRFGVQGYPTIKFFPPGKKDDSSAQSYDGQRTASALAEWAREKTKDLKHWQHVRLTSQSQYDQYCSGRNLCVIAFLPHILDSSQEERDAYLEKIKEVGLKFRGKPFKFLWAQGGDHFEFEEKLGAVGVGYPVISIIYESKKLFGKLKKSFNEQNLENFLNDILNNKARFNKLPNLQKLKTIKEQAKQSYGGSQEGCGQDLCTAPPTQSQDL